MVSALEKLCTFHSASLLFIYDLTGAKGFEPLNGWTKTSCLTTWRRPNVLTFIILPLGCGNLSRGLTKKFENLSGRRSPALVQVLLTEGRAIGILILNSAPCPVCEIHSKLPECFSTTI